VKGLIALAVLRLALKLDLGPEYDTNANRAETVDGIVNVDHPTGSALLRTTTRLSLAWQSGASLLRVSGGLGAKIFFNPAVFDQDTLVGQLGVDERVTLGRYVDFGLTTDYYDAGQLDVAPPCAAAGCNRHRDFRSGASTARLSLIDELGDLTFTGGWRGFQYKPDAEYDFEAAQASVVANFRAHAGAERNHEIGLTAGYHLERRWFSGTADLLSPTCSPESPCIEPGTSERLDWFHETSVELSYLGPVLVTAGYDLQLNSSNSYDQSLTRHIVTLRLAGRLPWQLYATLKGQIIKTIYLHRVPLASDTQTCQCIEDENRNSLIADLERPIGKTGLSVEARYSFYTNELGATTVHFTRHVIYLGLTYKAGWRLGKTAPAAP
jgi:hypothetical protein